MAILLACCVLLVVVTTVIHYEVLRLLSFGLPRLRIQARAKLILVIIAAFGSHALQMLLYGGVYYVLIHTFRPGGAHRGAGSSFAELLVLLRGDLHVSGVSATSFHPGRCG